jgi:hypothetical protein
MRRGQDKELSGQPNTNEIKISKQKKRKKDEKKNKPTPHCQSKIMSSLSVRAKKMMEKNSGHFSRAPLQGTLSSLMN